MDQIPAIIGGGCSVATEPVALLANVYSLPQLGYSSTGSDLSDKIKFPYFMRLISSDSKQARAWLGAAKHFNWKRVGTLNSQESIHANLAADFLKGATKAGIEVVSSGSFPGSQGFDMTEALQEFSQKGVTIIFLACYDTDARTVIRLMEDIDGLNAANNTVIVGTDAWLSSNLLYPQNSDNSGLPVIEENLRKLDVIREHAVGIIGFTFAQGNSERRQAVYQQYVDENGFEPLSAYIDFAYDVAHVLAHGIHRLVYDEGLALPDPITSEWRSRLHEELLNTHYEGISKAPISFDESGDGNIAYECRNVIKQDDEYVYQVIGLYNPADDIWEELADPVWRDGSNNTPLDRPPVVEIYISESLKWAFVGLAIFCCMTPIVNAILLIINWRDEHIKAATPQFLALILFGTLLSMCTVFVIAVTPTDATCIIPHWFNHMAYWIIFSCLFIKTARIWWIFNMVNKLQKPPPVKFSLIAGVVAIMISLAGLYLGLWTGLDMMRQTSYPDPLNPTRITIIKCYYSKNWAVALYAVELAFLAVGVVLAYKINKIKILKKNMLRFNESSHIALSIYSIIFVGVVIIPNILWLTESNDTIYILSCVGILVINLTLNFALFMPKWKAIWANKQDTTTSSKVTDSENTNTNENSNPHS
eukprot:TRINITY_DN7023_c0_g1_i2.p1 TRINITY_DN7023_c0_g1~~TRINITY_DN7023_c0_g1_i2.p1  ORF type:complete len:647 (-),score=104.60 TRINITY_DN7023_c0_g1_i2:26-1966(-)